MTKRSLRAKKRSTVTSRSAARLKRARARASRETSDPGRPVPHHGSGPDDIGLSSAQSRTAAHSDAPHPEEQRAELAEQRLAPIGLRRFRWYQRHEIDGQLKSIKNLEVRRRAGEPLLEFEARALSVASAAGYPGEGRLPPEEGNWAGNTALAPSPAGVDPTFFPPPSGGPGITMGEAAVLREGGAIATLAAEAGHDAEQVVANVASYVKDKAPGAVNWAGGEVAQGRKAIEDFLGAPAAASPSMEVPKWRIYALVAAAGILTILAVWYLT